MEPTPRPPLRPAPSPVPASLGLPPGRLTIAALLQDLQTSGMITAETLKKARSAGLEARGAEVHPLVLIADLKLPRRQPPGAVAGNQPPALDLEALTEWLAERCKLPYLRIDPTKIEVGAVTELMSLAYAQRHRILPVAVDSARLRIATSEPRALAWQADLRNLLRREIDLCVASPLDLARYTLEFFGVTRSLRGAREAKQEGPGLPNFEQLVELGKAGDIGSDDQHIVHIVDWLLQFANEQRASDIHLEPRRGTSKVRFRIDGQLHKVFEMPTPVMTAVVARIKVLGRMDLAERRRPQDGRIKTRSPTGREVEMRLSTMPTAFGEKCVLRLFDPDTALKPLDELGFSEQEASIWKELTGRPHGIVLVTGPTGSGKTTTLYATLQRLATPDVNVCTVEDPIEMIAPEFNQMQVQSNIDLSFAAGVRTLLRQDPDIIMIGEIRDLETAQMAVQAALTGHLVLSTLHTNDAPSAITRLLDLGIPHYLIASTLNGVLAQRLARTLCQRCKAPGPLDLAGWQLLSGHQVPPADATPMRAVGCIDCRQTGYRGRIGLYELLSVSPALRGMIHAQLDVAGFTHAARAEGMRSLTQAGAEHVVRGHTTLSEVLSVLPS